MQLAAAVCRHYWPVSLVLAVVSQRCRRAVLAAAIIDGAVDWLNRRQHVSDDTRPLGLVSYVLMKRLDDLAYGAGLWCGAVQERTVTPLKPQIKA